MNHILELELTRAYTLFSKADWFGFRDQLDKLWEIKEQLNKTESTEYPEFYIKYRNIQRMFIKAVEEDLTPF